MPLRKLSIDIMLPRSATGLRAKEEHARIIRSVLQLVENPNWAAFTLPVHDSQGNEVGRAVMHAGETVPVIRKEQEDGVRQSAAA